MFYFIINQIQLKLVLPPYTLFTNNTIAVFHLLIPHLHHHIEMCPVTSFNTKKIPLRLQTINISCWAMVACLAAFSGCSQWRLPKIDPSGGQIISTGTIYHDYTSLPRYRTSRKLSQPIPAARFSKTCATHIIGRF